MVMIQASFIETLIVALGMMGTQYYIDEYHKPHLYIVSTQFNQIEQYYIHIHRNKGNYFCPSHCAIEHSHIAHKSSYNCSTSCSHKTYVEAIERVKLPKKKKKKPNRLPMNVEGVGINYTR